VLYSLMLVKVLFSKLLTNCGVSLYSDKAGEWVWAMVAHLQEGPQRIMIWHSQLVYSFPSCSTRVHFCDQWDAEEGIAHGSEIRL
jgi:hypothetical protein